jgi:hypothetical protein
MTWQWKPNQRVTHYHVSRPRRYYRRHSDLGMVLMLIGAILVIAAIVMAIAT